MKNAVSRLVAQGAGMATGGLRPRPRARYETTADPSAPDESSVDTVTAFQPKDASGPQEVRHSSDTADARILPLQPGPEQDAATNHMKEDISPPAPLLPAHDQSHALASDKPDRDEADLEAALAALLDKAVGAAPRERSALHVPVLDAGLPDQPTSPMDASDVATPAPIAQLGAENASSDLPPPQPLLPPAPQGLDLETSVPTSGPKAAPPDPAPAEPDIVIEIGQIDLHPPAAPPRTERARVPRSSPLPSLKDYLRGTNG